MPIYPPSDAPEPRPGAASSLPSVAAAADSRWASWRDYLELTKPEITLLVALSSLGGYLLAPAGLFDGWTLLSLVVGVTLTSGGASALNHWIERGIDAEMRRTMNRPLPAGRIGSDAARHFGCILLAAGVGLLCPLTNPLTGVLAVVTALLYLFVYTPLKRVTTWNTLIGTVPGALPALGGWTAATGSFGWGGWAMFAVLAAWQMPHFLSLAWMYRKDYERGGHVMLPVTEPSGRSTVGQTLFFTGALVAASLWPVVLDIMGWIYALSASLLGAWFLYHSAVFFNTCTKRDARRVLRVSIYYIPALVLAILIDRLILGGLLAG